MNQLTNDLVKRGYLRSDEIIQAFADTERVFFLSEDLAPEAHTDIALPIGYGQTISQPSTVAFMLELLNPQKGNNIMDIGSGSGWTTALLAHIVGNKGKVTSIEVIPELWEMGKKNVGKLGYAKGNVDFQCINAKDGYEKNAPYDGILVSAASDDVPESLKKQLKIGGKMVIPTNGKLTYIERKSEDEFQKEDFPGFAFVPFVD